MLRLLAFFCLIVCSSCPAWAEVQVNDVRLGSPEAGVTRFVLELDQQADYRLFFLANPSRLVLDMPTLTWPQHQVPSGSGLVKGWRYGQFGEGTRIVLDLSAPVSFSTALDLPARDGKGPRLVLDLRSGGAPEFAKLIGQSWGQRGQQSFSMAAAPSEISAADSHVEEAPSALLQDTPATLAENNDLAEAGLSPAALIPASAPASIAGLGVCPKPPQLPERRRNYDPRPLVVLDAGHGGVDPGAIGVNGVREKDITLAVVRQLADRLKSSGHYRVAMTRSRDVFVPLRERVAIARRQGADLFISIHADSAESSSAQGSTIYTLSERASDREAARLADSENRSDQLAGLEAVAGDDNVASLLTTMSYAASLNQSRDFSALLASELGRHIRMTDQPQRSAGFAVLKAPDMPSALIEMGYLSNRAEVRLLTQPDHQRQLVSAIERGVEKFFLRHSSDFEAQLIAARPQ